MKIIKMISLDQIDCSDKLIKSVDSEITERLFNTGLAVDFLVKQTSSNKVYKALVKRGEGATNLDVGHESAKSAVLDAIARGECVIGVIEFSQSDDDI